MSQFYQGVTAGSLPPTVATSYSTDNGNAVPASNVLIIHGTDSSEDNANGIISKGGVIGTGTSNEVDLVFTNRIHGSATTSDGSGQTKTLVTFTLPLVAGTYLFSCDVVAYNTNLTLSSSYKAFFCFRFDGAGSTTQISTPSINEFEEGAMSGVLVVFGSTGSAFTITVTGLAGSTIDWKSVCNYTFVS